MKTLMLRVLKASTMFGLAALLVISLNSVAHARGQSDLATAGQATSSAVPQLVKFNGMIRDEHGRSQSSVVGITYALYKDQQGGAPLWLETQNVVVGQDGHYSVQLGSTKPQGLPAELFTSGEARWVGVQVQGQAEQPRVLLLSVPYALKAQDAETLGGKTASAFLAAGPSAVIAGASASAMAPGLSGGGKTNYIPLWLSPTKLGNSTLFQSKTGVGIGTIAPATTLDVNGASDIRNTLTLFPNGSAPTLSISGTAFRLDNKGVVNFVSGQTFPGTGTITGITAGTGLTGGGTSGKVTLSVPNSGITNSMLQNSSLTISAGSALTGGGAVSLGGKTTLGLQSCGANQILEFTGGTWTCTNAPTGTITGITAGTDLTGGGTSGNVTVNLNTAATDARYSQLNASNTFTGNQNVTGNLSTTGAVSANGLVSGGSSATFTGNVSGFQLVSTAPPGTSPFQVSSATEVLGLNAHAVGGWTAFDLAKTGSTNSFSANQTIAGGSNGQTAIIGDMGCGLGGAGIGFFGNPSGCTNYALLGFGSDTDINRPSGGYIRFRENNGASTGFSDQLTIAPGGDVIIGTGLGNDGGGFKHARLLIKVPANGYAQAYVYWTTPFIDDNYTVTTSLYNPYVADILTWTLEILPGYVRVELENLDGSDATVVVHAIAVHD
jgi:hypothetical protein